MQDGVEALKHRWPNHDILGLAVASVAMCSAELFGFGPCQKIVFTGPHGVRGIKPIAFFFRAFQHAEFLITLHFFQTAFAGAPDVFEGHFAAKGHFKPVHGNVGHASSFRVFKLLGKLAGTRAFGWPA